MLSVQVLLALLLAFVCLQGHAQPSPQKDYCDGFSVSDTHSTQYNITMIDQEISINKDTHICRVVHFPENHNLHAVRFEGLVQPHGLIHHISLHLCDGGENLRSTAGQQTDCTETGPACTGLVYIWTPEHNAPLCLPPHVGFHIGKEFPYAVLSVHYRHSGAGPLQTLDSSGVTVYATRVMREHDAGVLRVGAANSIIHLEPNAIKDIKTTCPAACMTQVLPVGGIKMFAAIVETHMRAVHVDAQIVRNNYQLARYTSDEPFEVRHQRSFVPPSMFISGDSFHTDCRYNTSGAPTVINGGPGMDSEQCVDYIAYYPKVKIRECLVTAQNDLLMRDGRPTATCGDIRVDTETNEILEPCNEQAMHEHMARGLAHMQKNCKEEDYCSSNCFVDMLAWLQDSCVTAKGFNAHFHLCRSSPDFPEADCINFLNRIRYCRGLCIVGQAKEFCTEREEEKAFYGFTGECVNYECQVSYLADTAVKDLNARNLAHYTLLVVMLVIGVFIVTISGLLLYFDIWG